MNDLRTIRFRRRFTFFKLGILGQKVWTFFPNSFERKLHQRVTNLRELARRQIEQRIEKQKNGEAPSEEFIDILVADHLKTQKTTVEVMIQQFLDLFFGGTDTVAALSAIILHMLGKDKSLQNELLEEIKEVIGEDGPIQFTKLSDLKKMGAVINETLRMYPPVTQLIFRHAQKDVQIQDVKIKAGKMS